MPRHQLALISLGCAKNLADSEDLLSVLKALDFGLVADPAQADLILINTCAFIGDAKKESIDRILEASALRRPGALLFVAGCLSQRYRQELAADLPEVDRFLSMDDYPRLAGIIGEHFSVGRFQPPDRSQRSQLTPPHWAWLKIAEGCDYRCSFCAIPLIRGPHVSRPLAEVVADAQVLAGRGVQEICLISQHLDSYGRDRYRRWGLADLVRRVAVVAPDSWIRLHYVYPDRLDDRLLRAMAECPNVLHYLDLPIQHASDRVLRLMNRRTNVARLRERIHAVRSALPDVALRTTCLVGHPGESEDDFQELLAFLEEIGFDQVGAFRYSREEGTAAATLDEQVPARVSRRRFHLLMTRQARLHAQRLTRWHGQVLTCLVDGRREDGRWSCRHYGQAPEVDSTTLVTARRLLVGQRVPVRITGSEGYDLVGRR